MNEGLEGKKFKKLNYVHFEEGLKGLFSGKK